MKEEVAEIKQPLISLEKYLESGVHIGSKFRSGDMRKFIYKFRSDGLCVLNLATLNDRIKIVAQFLSKYEPSKVLVVAGRVYARKPAKKFAECVGAINKVGRFIPGTLTNPGNENFIEPEIVFAADPPLDRQAIREAITAKIPVVSLCDTASLLKNIDLVIPCNNKGKKSLALVYWLLARECLKERGVIKKDSEFNLSIEDFESKVERDETDHSEKGAGRSESRDRGGRGGGYERGGFGGRGGFGRGGFGGRGGFNRDSRRR